MDYDREPYQDLVDHEPCAFCGDVLVSNEKMFCSNSCRNAYLND